MFFKKKAVIILLFLILASVVTGCISCSDNRTPGQKAYDFIQMFDRRSHLEYRSGIYEYDEGKKVIQLANSQSREDELKSYSLALDHFQKARSYFSSAKDYSSVTKSTDENALNAINGIVKASEFYIEATDIYISSLKAAKGDENFDIKNALSEANALEYRAEKIVLEVHENIKAFEDKYPEVFGKEWKTMIEELIQEQKIRLENISLIYKNQSQENN